MELLQEQVEKLVAKLITDTKSGKIVWSRREPRWSPLGLDERIGAWYEIEYYGRNIAVYELDYTVFDPERETTHWDSRIVLVILNSMGFLDYQFSPTSGLFELFRYIQYVDSDVEGFLNSVLGEGNKKKDE